MAESLRIELFPADVDRSVGFYESLGFRASGRSADQVPYAVVRRGDVRIGLCQAAPVDPASRGLPVGTEIVIEVDDVHATRGAVVGKGVDLSASPCECVRGEWR